jgi:hypothetical protein
MEIKTMKCVKSIETKEINRVSNEKAEQLVMKGSYVFCSKKEWKDAGRPVKKGASHGK